MRALRPEDAAGAGVDEDRGRRADADVVACEEGRSEEEAARPASAACERGTAGVVVRLDEWCGGVAGGTAAAAECCVACRPTQIPAPAAASTTSSTSEILPVR